MLRVLVFWEGSDWLGAGNSAAELRIDIGRIAARVEEVAEKVQFRKVLGRARVEEVAEKLEFSFRNRWQAFFARSFTLDFALSFCH